MKIEISVDSNWLFSNGGYNSNFIGKLNREIGEKWRGQIGEIEYSIFDCQFEYQGSSIVDCFAKEIKELVESVAGVPYDEKLFHITIEENGRQFIVDEGGSAQSHAVCNTLFDQINALRENSFCETKDNPTSSQTIKSDHTASHSTSVSTSTQETRESSFNATQNHGFHLPEVALTEEDASERIASAETGVCKKSAFDKIQNLVGSDDFKSLARDINNIAPQIVKNHTQQIFFSEVYLFSINVGSGYHSSIKLLNDLLNEVGLFINSGKPDVISIPSYNDADMANKMKNAVSALENALERQRLLSIDISEWIGHTHSREFKKLAMHLFRSNKQCSIVFRIPYVKQAVIDATVNDISDVISTRPVVFKPFSGEELRELAQRYLDENKFTFSEKAWEIFDNQIDMEKADGFFYGIHTVHKLVGDIIRKKELMVATTGNESKLIAEEITGAYKKQEDKFSTDNLETLNNMIGMQAITARVIEIVNQIVYSRQSGIGSKPTMHMCFVGNPGTGKTTVARIIGNVLKERGVLRIGKFYEHHGRDLCAEYVGQTAPKTHAICQEAYGSVLFIDEAYSLATDGDRYNYGKEAIDTLITEMENNGDDLIVIFAGYPDEIQKMISLNPGMRSRIPYTLEFPNYTREQLAGIFMEMANKSFSCMADLEPAVSKYFNAIPSFVLNDKAFGNGRFVRNIFERTWGKALARSSENGFDGITLIAQDFIEATKEFQFDKNVKPDRKIGF